MLARIDTLGPAMFLDYPWLILVRLYLAEAEGRIVELPALKPHPAVADSIIRRGLMVAEAQGWITSVATNEQSTQLTTDGVDKIERLLETRMPDRGSVPQT